MLGARIFSFFFEETKKRKADVLLPMRETGENMRKAFERGGG